MGEALTREEARGARVFERKVMFLGGLGGKSGQSVQKHQKGGTREKELNPPPG